MADGHRMKGNRIYTRIYPTKDVDPRSVWTRTDAEYYSENFDLFKPLKLRVEHDKSDDGVVGEVLDFHFDRSSGWTAGNAVIHDPVQLKRIQNGEIDSVSFSFTETSTHLNPGELSLVEKPFFKGAKILSNYNEQGQREIIVPIKESANFFRGYIDTIRMEQQQQQNPASVSSTMTPEEMAQEIMNVKADPTTLPETNEQMLRHNMSPEQRARFDSLPPDEKAAFVGKAMREIEEKDARLREYETREAQRQQAEMEARLNQARPLVEKISARTMNKNLNEQESEAAKLGMAMYLTSPGGQWAAKAWSGMLEESERNQQQLSALQKQVAELRDLTQRSQAFQQAGIQPVVQHAYNAELGAKTAAPTPQRMSQAFDRLFGDFHPSNSASYSSSSSTTSSSSSSYQQEQPVEHNYNQQRGFKRDSSGANKNQQIPKTAFAARVADKLMREGPIPEDKQGRTDEREIVHNYSMTLGQTINTNANADPETMNSDVVVTNLANAAREQFMIKRGNVNVWEDSWAKQHPEEFDELVRDLNTRSGPPPTNGSAGWVGVSQWKQMDIQARRAHPELSFMDAPRFEENYVFKLDTTSRHNKRQRK